jgi:hypothetical protein
MNMWRNGGIAPQFFALALDGGEWSSLCSSCFAASERASGTHCIGGWTLQRREKSLALAGNHTMTVQAVGHHYTD